MQINPFTLFLLIIPFTIHSQDLYILPIDDSRFIASYNGCSFTTGSDLEAVVNCMIDDPEITNNSFHTYYRWEGIELRLFRNYSDIGLITISSEAYATKSGVRIGQTLEEVIDKNGVPDSRTPGQLFYTLPIDGDESFYLLELQFKNDILVKILIGTAI